MSTRAKKKAEELLKTYGLEDPIIDVRYIAEREGLNVVFVRMPDQLQDVAGFLDKDRNRMYIERNDSPTNQFFAIAHELGHFILNHQPSEYGILCHGNKSDSNLSKEGEANDFAMNLLIPKTTLLREIKENGLKSINNLLKTGLLAKFFGVSTEIMKRRMQSLGLY